MPRARVSVKTIVAECLMIPSDRPSVKTIFAKYCLLPTRSATRICAECPIEYTRQISEHSSLLVHEILCTLSTCFSTPFPIPPMEKRTQAWDGLALSHQAPWHARVVQLFRMERRRRWVFKNTKRPHRVGLALAYDGFAADPGPITLLRPIWSRKFGWSIWFGAGKPTNQTKQLKLNSLYGHRTTYSFGFNLYI